MVFRPKTCNDDVPRSVWHHQNFCVALDLDLKESSMKELQGFRVWGFRLSASGFGGSGLNRA